MSDVNSAPPGRKGLAFGTWRRLVVTQIICRGDLSPVARVVAYAIAQASNRNTRSTYASSMTIGQKINLFPDQVTAAITELVKNGQVRIKQRDNGTRDIFLLLRSDIEIPDLAVRAGSEFYKTGKYGQFVVDRGKFLDRIFADGRLTATDKIIAFAALRLMLAEYLLTISSYETIGKVVGRSRICARHRVRRGVRPRVKLRVMRISEVPI